jgi:hypothetical protein
MPYDETRKAWDRFESEIQGLAGELKRHYRDGGEGSTAEMNRTLDQLKQAAESVFKSLETATRDPDVRSRTKQTARSFGSALTETFREVTDEIEKALKRGSGD